MCLLLRSRNRPLGKLAPYLGLNRAVEFVGIDAHHVMQCLIDGKPLTNEP